MINFVRFLFKSFFVAKVERSCLKFSFLVQPFTCYFNRLNLIVRLTSYETGIVRYWRVFQNFNSSRFLFSPVSVGAVSQPVWDFSVYDRMTYRYVLQRADISTWLTFWYEQNHKGRQCRNCRKRRKTWSIRHNNKDIKHFSE